jgi:hypothetical protein
VNFVLLLFILSLFVCSNVRREKARSALEERDRALAALVDILHKHETRLDGIKPILR